MGRTRDRSLDIWTGITLARNKAVYFMLTTATLPSWPQLVHAALRRPPPDHVLAAPWHDPFGVAGWLSRSSWSLALIALWRKARTPASSVTVWLPDYFCNGSLVALRQTGSKLLFYPLTADRAPDMVACRALAGREGAPDVFVLVHYFGQAAPVTAAREFCARQHAWLVEDAVHALRPVQGIGAAGDFVLYSPHKHLSIPDGAVLVVRGDGPAGFGTAGLSAFGAPQEWPDLLRDLEGREGSARAHARPVIWILKRLMQKFGVRSWRTPALPFRDPIPSPAVGKAYLCSARASRIGRRLAAVVVGELPSVARRRQRNQLIWDELLRPDHPRGEMLVTAERPVQRNWTPYLAAYCAPVGLASRIYEEWQQKGLCVSTWPDLPTEVASDLQYHANAWHLRDSRVYLPVHQSLTAASMMRKCRPSAEPDGSSPRLNVVWNGSTPDQWSDWIAQSKRSNMLQAWAYGDAKCTAEGWRVKRAVFYSGEEPVALVQVLEKRVAKLLKVHRINRGPLLLRPLSAVEERALWIQLGDLGCLWRGRVLAVAPELPLSGRALILLDELGFKQFSPIATESVWVDLTRELGDLRKSINGKWRNMLVSAEKAGLALEIGGGDELFDWMIAKYESLMEARNFSGASVGLLRALHKKAGSTEKLTVLRALHEGEPVAGICVARHGCAATYLLGWNGHAGRRLKPNQFLLWQAIRYLKEAGAQWFDLGGISEENTPGITAFKLGLNGERYELVGEYWKW